MGEPIKIVVVAQTEEAAAKLQDFAKNSGGQLDAGLKQAAKSSHELSEGLGQNRLAMMELGHVGRATAEGLAAGISPLRVLALESPRILQSFSMMGISLAAMAPYLIAAGAAAGVFALEWYAVMGGIEDSNKEAEKFVSTLDKLPDLLKRIQLLGKAGLISPAVANRMADELSFRKPLYIGPDGEVTPDATHQTPEQKYQPSFTPGQPGAMQFTGNYLTVPNRMVGPQDMDKLQKYEQDKLNQFSDKQADAIAQVKAQEKSAHEESMTGIEKEKSAVIDKYTKQREQILETAKLAGAPMTVGGIRNPQIDSQAAKAVEELNAAQATALSKIDADNQKKILAEQAASETQIRTAEAKRAAASLQTVEDQITQMESQEGVKRGQFAAVEYTLRVTAAQRAYFAGDIAEQEYTHRVVEAAKQRTEAEKAFNNEKRNALTLSQQIEQAELEGKLAAINGDPFKNNQTKAQESIPLYQKLISRQSTDIAGQNDQLKQTGDETAQFQIRQKISDITRQQIENEQKLKEAQGEGNWQATYTKNLVALQNEWQDLSVSLTNGAFRLIQQGVQGIANALTSVIMGTQSAGAAFASFAEQLLTSFISMVLEAILWAKLAIPILTYLGVVSGGTTTATGAAVTIAAIGAAMAVMGLADGGLVSGPGTGTSDSIAARLSHGEFVVNAEATRRVGPDFLQAINSGAVHRDSAGAAASRSSSVGKGGKAGAHVILVNDRSEMMNALKSADAEQVIVAAVRKNRLKIGVTT